MVSDNHNLLYHIKPFQIFLAIFFSLLGFPNSVFATGYQLPVSVSNDSTGTITISDYSTISANPWTGGSYYGFTTGCYSGYLCVGQQQVFSGNYPDETNRLTNRPGANLLLNMFDSGVHNIADDGYLTGVQNPGDGTYWAKLSNYPSTGDF